MVVRDGRAGAVGDKGAHRMDGAPTLAFDLDGTLADTAGDLLGTLGVLLQRDGHPAPGAAAARGLVGAGARAMIQRGYAVSGATLDPDRLELLFHAFIALYRERIAQETRLFPGALEALERLREAGCRLAICTNKSEDLALLLLDRLGVADRFHAICGRDSFVFHKPDPRALLLAIEKAGGDPARAVMIGDSKTDIDTAKSAGVPAIAVDFGYTEIHVAELGPDRVISHFDELWDAAASLGLFGATAPA
jgi:phosphoglycolate phosphatase